jgi:farnesol dehydrogenase
MKYFITGVSGFIGSNLARELSMDGHTVNAIVRSPLNGGLQDLPGIHLVHGDLFDKEVLLKAMEGCDVVFHLAALAKAWVKDPKDFYRINVEGAENVFQAARLSGVKKVVFTSTAGTMAPSPDYEPTDESTQRSLPYFNEYEVTKARAEELARDFSRHGLAVVIVNPTRVYGPGPLNASNSVTKMIDGYRKGKWRIIPGNGKKIGNYVYIDDVVHGHLLAAQNGKAGERYILGGENLTFDEFFSRLGYLTGRSHKMFHFPLSLMAASAKFMELQNLLTGIPPLITEGWVKKFLSHWSLSSDKARNELGYRITPFESGVSSTIEWLEREEVAGELVLSYQKS